jgi:hypothetical protein
MTNSAFALGSRDQLVELNHGEDGQETNNSTRNIDITIRNYNTKSSQSEKEIDH